MTSLRDCGLNIWIPSEISAFKPPMNVPINAFCVQPCTWLSSFSNSPLLIPQCPQLPDFLESFIKIFTTSWSEASP
jgi:hypothetical protein